MTLVASPVVSFEAGQSLSSHHQVLEVQPASFVPLYASLIESLRGESGESSTQLMG